MVSSLLRVFHKSPSDCITRCWALRLRVCQLWGGRHVSSQSTNPLRLNMFIWTLRKDSGPTLLPCAACWEDWRRWCICHHPFFFCPAAPMSLGLRNTRLATACWARNSAPSPGVSNSNSLWGPKCQTWTKLRAYIDIYWNLPLNLTAKSSNMDPNEFCLNPNKHSSILYNK